MLYIWTISSNLSENVAIHNLKVLNFKKNEKSELSSRYFDNNLVSSLLSFTELL